MCPPCTIRLHWSHEERARSPSDIKSSCCATKGAQPCNAIDLGWIDGRRFVPDQFDLVLSQSVRSESSLAGPRCCALLPLPTVRHLERTFTPSRGSTESIARILMPSTSIGFARRGRLAREYNRSCRPTLPSRRRHTRHSSWARRAPARPRVEDRVQSSIFVRR